LTTALLEDLIGPWLSVLPAGHESCGFPVEENTGTRPVQNFRLQLAREARCSGTTKNSKPRLPIQKLVPAKRSGDGFGGVIIFV